MKVNLCKEDFYREKKDFLIYYDSLSTCNKRLNNILKQINNKNTVDFIKKGEWYIVTYNNGQKWKFRDQGLLAMIENELQILLNRNFKPIKNKLF